MSLSDLFGDLGDEDDEEDYRPDSNQISDIEDDEEMEPAPQNSVMCSSRNARFLICFTK